MDVRRLNPPLEMVGFKCSFCNGKLQVSKVFSINGSGRTVQFSICDDCTNELVKKLTLAKLEGN